MRLSVGLTPFRLKAVNRSAQKKRAVNMEEEDNLSDSSWMFQSSLLPTFGRGSLPVMNVQRLIRGRSGQSSPNQREECYIKVWKGHFPRNPRGLNV